MNRQNVCPVNPLWDTRFKKYAFAGNLSDSLRQTFLNAEGLLGGAELIKNSRSTTAGIFVLDGREYFIKRSNTASLCGRLRRIGRMPRAVRNYLGAEKLHQLNIRTPEVYMALSTSPFGLPGASYLITESFAAPIHLTGRLGEVLKDMTLDELIKCLMQMLCRLHQAGMIHGDAKTSNILALSGSSGWEFGLFDLDSMTWGGCGRGSCRSELARTASSIYIALNEFELTDNIDSESVAAAAARAYTVAGGRDFSQDPRYYQRFKRFLLSAKII